MEKKVSAIFLLAGFATMLWISPTLSQMTRTSYLQATYEDFINEHISKLESKAAMHNSKCKNIRRAVALYSLKADFYKNHKTELIADMMAEDIGTKPHKIHYYLIKRFFGILREAIKTVDSKHLLRDED